MNNAMHHFDVLAPQTNLVAEITGEIAVKWKAGEKVIRARVKRLIEKVAGAQKNELTIVSIEEIL